VQLGNAKRQRLPRQFDHFVRAILETIGVALLAGKGAELAAQNAVIGVVEITVENIAGAVAHFLLSAKISDGAERIKVFAFKQPQRVRFGDAFARDHLFKDVAQLAALYKEAHFALVHLSIQDRKSTR